MLKRNISLKINRLAKYFPAVAIIGARQTGKTTLARQLFPDWQLLDLERMSDFDRITHDPEFFLEQHVEKVIFDEAQ